jgi:cyanate permease
LAFFTLHDYPETASFLTPEERTFVAYRLKYDGQDESTGAGHRIAQNDSRDWKHVRAAFADIQIWINVVVYWGYVCPLYGISLFLPTIIRELGYKSTTAQLLTVPIYVTASVITIAVAFVADKKKHRSSFIVVGLCFQLIGFVMCIATSNPVSSLHDPALCGLKQNGLTVS